MMCAGMNTAPTVLLAARATLQVPAGQGHQRMVFACKVCAGQPALPAPAHLQDINQHPQCFLQCCWGFVDLFGT